MAILSPFARPSWNPYDTAGEAKSWRATRAPVDNWRSAHLQSGFAVQPPESQFFDPDRLWGSMQAFSPDAPESAEQDYSGMAGDAQLVRYKRGSTPVPQRGVVPVNPVARGKTDVVTPEARAVYATLVRGDPARGVPGLSPVVAAGVLGNMMQESYTDVRPDASYKGHEGIGQWDKNRFADMQKWTAANGLDPKSREGQALFYSHELQDDPRSMKALEGVTSPAEAARAIEKTFERSGGSAVEGRAGYASAVSNWVSNVGAGMSAAYPPGQAAPAQVSRFDTEGFAPTGETTADLPNAEAVSDSDMSAALGKPTVFALQGQSHMKPAEDAAFKNMAEGWAKAHGADLVMVPRIIDGKTDSKEKQAQYVQDHVKAGDPPVSLFAYSAGLGVAEILAGRMPPGSIERVVGAGYQWVQQSDFAERGIAATIDPMDHSMEALGKVASVSAQAAAVAAPGVAGRVSYVAPVTGTFEENPSEEYGHKRGSVGRMHVGSDYKADAGNPVVAMTGGKVLYVGTPKTPGHNFGSSGNYVNFADVLGADGRIIRYAPHGSVSVKVGDQVQQGQQIGVVSGAQKGGGGVPHVHVEFIKQGTPAYEAAMRGEFGQTSWMPGTEAMALKQSDELGIASRTAVVAGQPLDGSGRPVEAAGAAQDATIAGRGVVGGDPYKAAGLTAKKYSPEGHAAYQQLANEAADRNGIPRAAFNSLVYNESGWNPKRVSDSGAQGLGQLMPGTAAEMGVTDPFDPKQNLDASAAYLKKQLDRTGSLEGAMAAYGGPNNKIDGVPYGTAVMNYAKATDGEYGGGAALAYAPGEGEARPNPQIVWGREAARAAGLNVPLSGPINYDNIKPPGVASAYNDVTPPAPAAAGTGADDEAYHSREAMTPSLPSWAGGKAPYGADKVVAATLANDPAALKAAWEGVKDAATAHPPIGAALSNPLHPMAAIKAKVGSAIGGYFGNLPLAVQQQMALNAHNNPELINATPEEGRAQLGEGVAGIMSGMGVNPQNMTSPIPIPMMRPAYTAGAVPVAAADPVTTGSVRTVGPVVTLSSGPPPTLPPSISSMPDAALRSAAGVSYSPTATSHLPSFTEMRISSLPDAALRSAAGYSYSPAAMSHVTSTPDAALASAAGYSYPRHATSTPDAALMSAAGYRQATPVIVSPAASAITFAPALSGQPGSFSNPTIANETYVDPALSNPSSLVTTTEAAIPFNAALGSKEPDIAKPPGAAAGEHPALEGQTPHPLYNPMVRNNGQLAGYPGVPQSAFQSGMYARQAGYGTTPTNMLSGLFSKGYSMPNFTPGGGGAVFAYRPSTSTGPGSGSGYTDVHGNWQATGTYVDSRGTSHSYDMG